MPTITKKIGANYPTDRDYSTPTAWEADLDDTGIYSSGDDAVGELYDDGDYDEQFTMNGGSTVGLNSVHLTAASGEGHDGTPNSGVRWLKSSSYTVMSLATPSGFGTGNYGFSNIEIDGNSKQDIHVRCDAQSPGNIGFLHRMLLHDGDGGGLYNGAINAASRDIILTNCVVYDFNRSGTNNYGVRVDCDRPGGAVYNNTIYNIRNESGGSGGNAYGLAIYSNDTDRVVRNNIAMGVDVTHATPGNENCFQMSGTNGIVTHNYSEDATADDAGATGDDLINQVVADTFVSTTLGSEDLSLKSGANAIDAGYDPGTTPDQVEIDMTGRDRDAQGDTWDMGAYEYVAAAGGITRSPGAGTLTVGVSGTAPTVDVVKRITRSPGAGSLNFSEDELQPTVTVHKRITRAPGTGSVTITGQQPTPTVIPGAGGDITKSPGAGSLTATGYEPTVTIQRRITRQPGTGSVTITGQQPSVGTQKEIVRQPGTGSATISGQAPTPTIERGTIRPGAGSIVFTGYAPIVTGGKRSFGGGGGLGPSGRRRKPQKKSREGVGGIEWVEDVERKPVRELVDERKVIEARERAAALRERIAELQQLEDARRNAEKLRLMMEALADAEAALVALEAAQEEAALLLLVID